MTTLQRAVEATVSGEREITLPPDVLRQLGWAEGTRLLVSALTPDTLIVARRPEDPARYYAGRLGDVFGDHGEIMGYLEEERKGWETETPDGNR
jgi:bifunctional DNA-binding transcriptional regulator/antitoxin component of YhaV-PrlF toxin-antitoxin module